MEKCFVVLCVSGFYSGAIQWKGKIRCSENAFDLEKEEEEERRRRRWCRNDVGIASSQELWGNDVWGGGGEANIFFY